MTKKTKFDLWIEYEKIAMHFNGLLMQLRLRALAGVSVIGTITGLLAKGDVDFNWASIGFVSLSLLVVWGAIFVIDKFYYDRLLTGAVMSLIDLERTAEIDGYKIGLSTQIESSAKKNRAVSNVILPVIWFYGIVAMLLFSISIFSFVKAGIIPPCFC